MSNVQSPGSQSSKGSSSRDQDFIPSTDIPASLKKFVTNNYRNNYYVPDQDAASTGAGSVEGLCGLDDVDEIDTNNMAIYSGDANIKDCSDGPIGMKQESLVANSRAEELPTQMPSTGKSLLLTPNSNAQEDIDADLMLNVLGDQVASTSGNVQNSGIDSLVIPNNMFDETSQVCSKYGYIATLYFFYFHAFSATRGSSRGRFV